MIVDGLSKKNMAKAVELIKAGEVVAFPTETVYGLGADAMNPKAVEKIFRIKQRPFADPLIVHVADLRDIERVALPLSNKIQAMAIKLMDKFWPGPLTLIFQKKTQLSDMVTGSLSTVGLRMPNHLIARALIKNANTPIAAPSANRFQSLSPTTAEAVERELGADIPVILDGGPCKVGLESTVLALIDGPMILRPGGVSQEDLEYILGVKVPFHKRGQSAGFLPSPGMLDHHYAPRKPLKFFSRSEMEKFAKKKANSQKIANGALLCFSKSDQKLFAKSGFFEVAVLSERGNLPEAARELFNLLRKLDEGKASSIFALDCPDEQLGVALNDRLKRADHGTKK
jgi:L-threonylcarbamoyladenylate synthase